MAYYDNGLINQLLDAANEQGMNLDEGLTWRLMRRVKWPKKRLCRNQDRSVEANGAGWHYLDETGCRIRFSTQRELARELGVSSSHLKHTLRLLREIGFIVTGGQGWLEFDARLVWKGDFTLRDVYIEFQRRNLPSLAPIEVGYE
ncbi:replication/maintenance protein RepL [Microvirga sp. 17 mud 1-3]|uniref:replication/maintenance protein RepL n=1 Tax=Microvirga sp. 17 mud 1-3 TaxID=2082949 RepID=UPI0013A5821E|nr:replication/maintenance protein RepL [Microvirga sp. 17 mud 1-3]